MALAALEKNGFLRFRNDQLRSPGDTFVGKLPRDVIRATVEF
jgi:hypothetical protein